jgi:membrane-bound lytic murein transglycosylase B
MRMHAIRLLLLLCFALPVVARADDPAFAAWLSDFRAEAHQAGIEESVLNNAFEDAEPIDRVLELDRTQPETTLTVEEYLDKVVTKQRIAKGRKMYEENRALLENVASKYDVQPRFIVALWGIETNYGQNTGGFDIVPALMTLAYDGRRSDYFRGELINALKIAQEERISPQDMEGSWAGAMGQCQFMPSSFLKYAVDFSGDGKRDIWNNQADVFASIANYLHTEGWNGDRGLGSANDLKSNFRVLLKWNRSTYFARAVGRLADKLKEEES